MERPLLHIRRSRRRTSVDANNQGVDSSTRFQVFHFSIGLKKIMYVIARNRGPTTMMVVQSIVQVFQVTGGRKTLKKSPGVHVSGKIWAMEQSN